MRRRELRGCPSSCPTRGSAVADILLTHAPTLLPGGKAPNRIALFVLTRAVDSVIRTAGYEGVDFLRSRDFEDELVRMVYGYLAAP